MDLAAFEGLWRVERQIEDRLSGRPARFSGEARFAPGEGGLIYHETGRLEVEGTPGFAAERRYLWRAGPEGIAVYFEDGRFFHAITSGTTPKAAHWCDPDDYQVRYDFTAWPVWRSTWEVEGPRKAYASHTTYARL